MQPGAPGQPQQQRFGLVICSMGRCHGIYPLFAQAFKAGIAQAAGPVLPGVGRRRIHRVGQFCRVEHPQRHPQCPAGLPHKGFVPFGGGAAQAVVHMAG